MGEQDNKLYLFNPFNIQKISDEEIRELYNKTYNMLLKDCNTMWELATNEEIYSNLEYITGEIIARLTEDIDILKNQIDIDISTNTVEERNQWNIEKDGKAPALDYFKGVAKRISKKDTDLLAKKGSNLIRFKYNYRSIEEKINALKKKQESIKYEEFNE